MGFAEYYLEGAKILAPLVLLLILIFGVPAIREAQRDPSKERIGTFLPYLLMFAGIFNLPLIYAFIRSPHDLSGLGPIMFFVSVLDLALLVIVLTMSDRFRSSG